MGQRLHLSLDDVGADQPKVTFWEIDTVHSFE